MPAEEMGKKDDQPAGTVYNIWYNKWAGGDRFGPPVLEKAETRCCIATDAGYTRASKAAFFCIHFARGCCAKGSNCTYWHRLPLETDRIPMTQDVFGRERFRDEREDMGGVGSFEKDNRTLYIGHLGTTGSMEATVKRHFAEWGEIEHVRVLSGKGVAFVRYKFRAAAEFAKEAMYAQSMDENEVLNVRWATEDPNPKAALERKRKAEEQAVAGLKDNLPALGDAGNVLDYANYYPSATDVVAAGGYNGFRALGEANMDPTAAYYYQLQQQAAAAAAAGDANGYAAAAYAAAYYGQYQQAAAYQAVAPPPPPPKVKKAKKQSSASQKEPASKNGGEKENQSVEVEQPEQQTEDPPSNDVAGEDGDEANDADADAAEEEHEETHEEAEATPAVPLRPEDRAVAAAMQVATNMSGGGGAVSLSTIQFLAVMNSRKAGNAGAAKVEEKKAVPVQGLGMLSGYDSD
ncbi:Pre-mRNA-splicing factor [Phlyctochytrium bullatum]|nr:Pre-mRNA-splicing factor [Phlyctochytrium bullatum]